MLSLIPHHANGSATSTPSQPQPMTVRQRFFGNWPTPFLVVMAVGLVCSLPSVLWPEPQLEPLLRTLAIFVGTPFAGAFDPRVRAASMLLIIGWLSILGGAAWPIALGLGLAAALTFYLHEQATEQLEAQAKVLTRAELSPLIRRLVVIKIGNAVSVAPAFAAAGASFLVGRGISAENVLGMVGLAGLVFAVVLFRHTRQFLGSVVGRPA